MDNSRILRRDHRRGDPGLRPVAELEVAGAQKHTNPLDSDASDNLCGAVLVAAVVSVRGDGASGYATLHRFH